MNLIKAAISFGGGDAIGNTNPPTIYDALNIQPLHFWLIVILAITVIILGIIAFRKK